MKAKTSTEQHSKIELHPEYFVKEMKNAPSALLSKISTKDFFKNTREVLGKNEPQAKASRTSRVFLKKSEVLI